MMQALKGSLVALVTPMNPDGEIDYQSLDNLIDWHIQEGTNGIVSVGTTGESATIDFSEHIDVISHTVKYVDKRVPVIAGTGANSTSEAIDLTKEAKKVGADCALLVTPYYNKPNQKGLITHYTKIANSVEIPQILYNVTSRTACDLIPESVEILSKHQNIIGIKEALNDQTRMKELVKLTKDDGLNYFYIFSGDDGSFLDLLMLGGHGVISVAANVVPSNISNICRDFFGDGIKVSIKENKRLSNLYDLLFIESNPIPVKWMLFKMGLIENSLRLPLVNLDKKYEENIMSEMVKLKLL
jgi:4-hydroxy-tetrahydrodipicolinate synthase